jgi:hypothetical protein
MANYFQILVKNKSRFRFLAAAYLGIFPSFSLENTNISGYDDLYQLFDYNRLRGEIILDHDRYSDLSATLIVDNESLYKENPGGLGNKASIYRAYLEYRGSKHYWVLGKQRISLGVGRFWNPMDVFNPIDIQAIEPNERPGIDSIHYEYALSQLSNIDFTLAKGKGTLRMKGYLDFADIALVAEWDDSQNIEIIGWELEGELAETGIELRTEGGSFHNRDNGIRHTEFIVGAEYGFANSLVLTGEYHFIDDPELDEFALSASIQPTMLWTCYLINVVDLDDGSGFILPILEYALSDEMTLSGGAFVYHGDENSIYGFSPDRFYIRWFIHF